MCNDQSPPTSRLFFVGNSNFPWIEDRLLMITETVPDPVENFCLKFPRQVDQKCLSSSQGHKKVVLEAKPGRDSPTFAPHEAKV